MKLFRLMIVMLVAVALLTGCENETVKEIFVEVEADVFPAAPQNIQTVTADEAVYIYFNGVYEADIAEYWIYSSFDEFDGYTKIGTVVAQNNPDGRELIVYEYIDLAVNNGVTYFYAVSAVDDVGQVSDLSAETALDTPRPEGAVTLTWDNDTYTTAGFNLASQTRLSSRLASADVWLDTTIVNGVLRRYINVGNENIDIQDMGYTSDFDEISFAPDCVDCWSVIGYTELIAGHTYIIWTASDNYAKMRVLGLNGTSSVTFQWGYQTAVGNLELKPVVYPRPVHNEDYPATDKRSDQLR